MKIKSLLNILGALLVILGLTMTLPMLISFGYAENNDFKAFWHMPDRFQPKIANADAG